jgi:hypothetical protein
VTQWRDAWVSADRRRVSDAVEERTVSGRPGLGERRGGGTRWMRPTGTRRREAVEEREDGGREVRVGAGWWKNAADAAARGARERRGR